MRDLFFGIRDLASNANDMLIKIVEWFYNNQLK